jgi:ABC-type transporter Mla subunit MlaD
MCRSTTNTLVEALNILARDIQSEDGVANACIAEAAQRLQEQEENINDLRDGINNLCSELDKLRNKENGNAYRPA